MNRFLHLATLTLLLVALLLWQSPTQAAPHQQSTVHIVQQGETLSGIAARYGVSVEAIRAANGIYDANQIYAGLTLMIPSATSSSGNVSTASSGSSPYSYSSGYGTGAQQSRSNSYGNGSQATASADQYASTLTAGRWPNSCGSVYTISPGDTLSGIAFRCSVSVSALASANGLSAGGRILLGQRLLIPGGTASASYTLVQIAETTSTCPSYWIVRSGDTLSAIAARCSISVEALKRWNSLISSVVRVGQVLFTSGSSGGYGTPTPPSRTPGATATPWPYGRSTPTPHLEPTIDP